MCATLSRMSVRTLQKEAVKPITRAVETGTRTRHDGLVAAFTFLAWPEEAIHNPADLPNLGC